MVIKKTKTKWQCGRGSGVKLKSKTIGPSMDGTDSVRRRRGLATPEKRFGYAGAWASMAIGKSASERSRLVFTVTVKTINQIKIGKDLWIVRWLLCTSLVVQKRWRFFMPSLRYM